ncbi:dTDP-4-dehydrorhamnose 3,5-epimerase [Fodinisporobacter ferrooxydans]|uniref:dTDP-4-dehydrorhamnose 3,5-epimerase n=1 Tax=Fodinisporobacter ferrooxydans TaxID=2901836 RepID=A0ABY4CLW2_9BACL|nr:dTDP-4-dehydrorhamnose 3,5-epimerase [Alicyclobacillaceae bacterium MYW30-H2]
MQLHKTRIPGCFTIQPLLFKDERGVFVKTFRSDVFAENHLETHFPEQYYSISRQGVLRGLHFQIPPREHTKLVYCVSGKVMDVIVDLRRGSPAFGNFEVFELSAEEGNMIYIPPGLAHGFYVTSERAILVYNVSSLYSPEHDCGIHWRSIDLPWPNQNPILSERDGAFPHVSNFSSPFSFEGGEKGK